MEGCTRAKRQGRGRSAKGEGEGEGVGVLKRDTVTSKGEHFDWSGKMLFSQGWMIQLSYNALAIIWQGLENCAVRRWCGKCMGTWD